MENLRDKLYGLAKQISLSNNGIFEIPVEGQRKYLQSLGEPRDCIERSYYQYKCQRWLKKRRTNILTDICSIPLIVYYFLKKGDPITREENSNVFLSFGIPNSIIPDEAVERYGKIRTIEKVGDYISKADKKILVNLIKKYPFSPEFILKCLIKIREYSWVINKFNPKAVLVSEEYSYTSSYLTYYCHEKKIEHVCVMHGEKLYYIRDSFFKFDKFYVWDQYYVELFILLRAAPNQYEIAVPPALKVEGKREIENDFTYYLANEGIESVERIISHLKTLSSMGYRVNVRPHPRYTDSDVIQRIVDAGISIENLKSIGIEHSLLSTENAISLYSTVLNQAVSNGIGVVIDDISNKEKYEKLYELKYRFVEDKRTIKLSSVIHRGI